MIDTTNKFLIPLDENAVLWRYMDFPKFKAMITEKSLFYCRADRFTDGFEGSIPRKEFEFLNRKPNHIRKGFDLTYKGFRRSSMISCWHISENESNSMWDLYSQKKGIAIKTNKERVFESLKNCNERILASKVRYINYETDTWFGEDYQKSLNFLSPLIHKRIEFRDEREFRLIIHREEIINDLNYWDNQPYKSGIKVEVDILKLIERIILSPNIEPEIKKNVEELAYRIGIIVEDSKLSSTPLF